MPPITDTQYAQNIAKGDLASAKDVANAAAEIQKQRTRIYNILLPVDGAAATAIAENFGSYGIPIEFNGLVYAVYCVFDGAVAGSDTNYGTMQINYRTPAGASQGLVFTGSSSLAVTTDHFGTVAQYVRANFTVAAASANVNVSAGGCLTFIQTKTGTGVVFPVRQVTVLIQDQ